MEIEKTEKFRAYVMSELKKGDVEIEMVDGKPLFHYRKELVNVAGGLEVEDKAGERVLSLNRLDAVLVAYFNKTLIFRASSDTNIAEIVKNGVDKEALKSVREGSVTAKGAMDIFASPYLGKASEYGHERNYGKPLESDVTVLLYDGEKMAEVQHSLQYSFLEDPKDTFLGVLILHGSKSVATK